MSQSGMTHLKNDEGAIDGIYDDPSDYGTFGVGHLVHLKDKWASFLVAAASADPGWKRLVVNSNGTSLLPRATVTSSDLSKMKSTAVDIAKDTIAQARHKTDYAKLTPKQAAEVDAQAASAVEAEATMLAQSVDVVLRNDLASFEKRSRSN